MKIQILKRNPRILRNDEVSLKVSDEPVEVPEPIANILEEAWSKKLAQNPRMFNAERFYYLRTEDNGQRQEVVVARCDYKTFIGRIQYLEEHPDLSETELSDIVNRITIMGVANVIETEDGMLIFGKRSMEVTEEKGKVMLPCGGFMPKHYEGLQPRDIMMPSAKQIEDEVGRKTLPSELGYLGITRKFDFAAANPDLVFSFLQPIETSSEIISLFDKARDKWEHDRLLFVPAKPEVLLDLIDGKYIHTGSKVDFSFSGVGPLMLYGMNKFGDLWYEAGVKKLTARGIPVEEISIDRVVGGI